MVDSLVWLLRQLLRKRWALFFHIWRTRNAPKIQSFASERLCQQAWDFVLEDWRLPEWPEHGKESVQSLLLWWKRGCFPFFLKLLLIGLKRTFQDEKTWVIWCWFWDLPGHELTAPCFLWQDHHYEATIYVTGLSWFFTRAAARVFGFWYATL